MRKYLIFIGLKIVEIFGIGYIPYKVGCFMLLYLNPGAEPKDFITYWCFGALNIVLLAALCGLLAIIVNVNLEWADKLSRRK